MRRAGRVRPGGPGLAAAYRVSDDDDAPSVHPRPRFPAARQRIGFSKPRSGYICIVRLPGAPPARLCPSRAPSSGAVRTPRVLSGQRRPRRKSEINARVQCAEPEPGGGRTMVARASQHAHGTSDPMGLIPAHSRQLVRHCLICICVRAGALSSPHSITYHAPLPR
ncbi:hypothetical protein WOLCODRAFT_156489 [Wolfiporia cocos MD-104 SS10]|uniref:Uncharacterized protein n=1 Tax=Wolfiporia cocos (strain MD-104) TaxID=742152 RepID=A0A2H3J7P4_WOLCO|nr:hypothetical protein WOLCODRAFT_156489 [Wolfiporia cocos MD-104 SS10]